MRGRAARGPRRLRATAFVAALALAGAAGAEPPPRVVETYLLHCSGCHGADGRGVPGATPSLRGVGALLEREGGRAYLVRVPGVAQAPLDDAELAALLDWVLVELGGAPVAPGYTAAEVGALRATPIRDTEAARARLRAP